MRVAAGRWVTAFIAASMVTTVMSAALAPTASAASERPVQPARPVGSVSGLDPVAHEIGARPTVAGRVAALDRVTANTPVLSGAYGAPELWQTRIDGTGTTVAVVVSFGDPNAAEVLNEYSAEHGLPPADVTVITPAGPLPDCGTPAEAARLGCADWVGETDLDIVMVHLIAPGAHILIAATPVNETQGFVGMPEMMDSIQYIAEHGLADVMSLSFGTPEDDFPALTDPTTLDYGFRAARSAGIPVIAASGDCGATDNTADSRSQCQDVFPYRVVGWPASDPLVTAVGGTVPNLDANGNRLGPDPLWPESGAGLSKTYGRPSWQRNVAGIIGSDQRSIPDVTMAGTVGTSESSPLFAGVLALATQLRGGRLGFINPALYRLGPLGGAVGIVDVTSGNNSFAGVRGYAAGPGFDIASGWGTINATGFVPALAAAVSDSARQ
ncbi:MAG TPA: S53 family peptidase [Pseudonocardiaceae bacterium]